MTKIVTAYRFGAVEPPEYTVWCEIHRSWCVFQGLGEQVHAGTAFNLVDGKAMWDQSLRLRGPVRR